MIVGVIPQDVLVGKRMGLYCISDMDKTFYRGTTVIITGAEKCNSSVTPRDFFQIMHNQFPYFIKCIIYVC